MASDATDTIPAEGIATLDALFRARVARSPERIAYRAFDRGAGEWRSLSWREAGERVDRWRAGLAREGLEPGARVALALRNGPEWVLFEQAALSLGLVVVPLYPDDRPDSMAYILESAGVRLLLLQDAARWRRLAPALGRPLRVLVPGSGSGDDPRLRFVDDWLPPHGDTPPRPGAPERLATLVYTSGTTGRPKGVMLSHRNVLSNVYAALAMIPVYPGDRFLSLLPLAHMLERSAGYYLPMAAGASVAYARSVPQLALDLAAIRPTALIAVPRIFESAYGRLGRRLAEGPRWRRALFTAAVAAGWRRFEHAQGRSRWHPALLAAPLLRRVVGRPVLARLGGRLRVAVSGGAPLSPELARTFIGLGLDLCQGYGLTETSPVVSFNPPGDNRPEGIGRPLPGIDTRIAPDGELLVRGPGVMLGYWRDPAATAAVIDPEGWLHTGDLARRAGDHLRLTGRIKDVLVLSNGEKVPPAEMEAAIGLDPLIEQVMVVGEGRPFLAALLVLDAEAWAQCAAGLGLPPDESALASRAAADELLARIGRRLHAFPAWARIRRVHATLAPWTVEEGLLTPTLKVRRERVLQRHGEAVARFYEAAPGGR